MQPPVMLTTGPVEAYPAVLRALSRPIPYDQDAGYQAYYAAVVAKLAAAMGLSDMRAIVLPAEAILGIEAAAASLIGPDDVVLNLVSGVYGAGFADYARRHAGEVIDLAVPFDEAIDPAAVAAMIERRPEIGILAVCHLDTPSGTINPLPRILAVANRHGLVSIVDAVASFGGMDVLPEAVGADLFIASPAKCLGAPPGLTLVAASRRAFERIHANPSAPRRSFLSLIDWEHAAEPGRPFPVMPSMADMHGLEAALDQHAAEGAPAVWARHALTAAATRAGVRGLGLELWARDAAIAAPTVTAVRLPVDVDDARLRAAMRDRFGVLVSAGRGATAGRLIRIGHMGPAARPMNAVLAVAALGGALEGLGHPVDLAAGTTAAIAAVAAGSPQS
jgi:pyridoxamine--pyruvate transaminase